MTSARLCTEDHDGTEPTSASASRITSGGASMTTSRDACTATTSKLATQPHSRTELRSYGPPKRSPRVGEKPSVENQSG